MKIVMKTVMKTVMKAVNVKTGALLLAALLLATTPAIAGDVADMIAGGHAVSFATKVQHDGVTLTVTGPQGFVFRRAFAAGQEPLMALFDQEGNALADGSYTWELRLTPVLSAAVRQALAEARAQGDDRVAANLRNQGVLPREEQVASGYFTVDRGSVVSDALSETRQGKGETADMGLKGVTGKSSFDGDTPSGDLKDQLILDDLIVDGSACIGFDCVNGESFGFDTIRLKENNLRIKFQDTSGSASFPTNDWQLTANDSANGGANKFSIDDIDGGRTPFTIEARAPSNSLYVDDAGRVGLGTSTPVIELHVVDGDSPGLRLEQNGSSGFTPQTWDVAGNEANFFVRDVTNGSKLPFKIKPSAPTNSLFVNTNGDIGLGTQSPAAVIHAIRSAGAAAGMMTLENNARVRFDLKDTSADGATIRFLAGDNGLDIVETGGTGELVRFKRNGGGGYSVSWELGNDVTDRMTLDNAGNLTTAGTVNGVSDRNLKENFSSISGQEILDKLSAMEITRWNFKADEGIQHVGPMAQDFYAAFGLGMDERHIATVDADGVALAAIKALNEQLQAKDEMIRKLEERLTALENRTP